MNRLLTLTITAAAAGGVLLSAAAPASAQSWRGGERWEGRHGYDGGWRGDHRGWRHDGWRHDRWRGERRGYSRDYYRGYGHRWRSDCYTTWRWSRYYGRRIPVTRCY